MRVLAICNQKGGCGKTTTSINLGASLSFLGKKILLIDFDPQAHSTIGLGVKAEELEQSIFDVLNPESAKRPTLQDITIQVEKNLWLAPSQIVLTAIEQQLAGVPKREEYLWSALSRVQKNYDFVLIDCPPNLGLLTFNALRAAGEAIITIEPSSFSVHGLVKVNETINVLKEQIQHSVTVHALLTMLDNRNKFSREMVDQIRDIYRDRVLRTVIRNNIRLREAAQAGRPITRFDRHSTGFHDYLSLASEMIERGAKRQTADVSVLRAEEERLAKLLTERDTDKLETSPSEEERILDSASGEKVVEDEESSEEQLTICSGGEIGGEGETEESNAVSEPASVETVAEQHSPIKKEDVLFQKEPLTSKGVSLPDTCSKVEDSEPVESQNPDVTTGKEERPREKSPAVSPLLPIKGIRKYPLKVSGGYLFICKCPGAKAVQIVGDFTNWIAVNMNSPGGKSGFWTRVFSLTPGSHKYKFIVDGEWVNDINNSNYQRNPYGGIDSIVGVP
ncbi:MAG: AAA family ATPase [Candidatus Omnitrophica bacterium]|nr:AAA family ATPase [Candidatus Omnitrophota bacterium]